MSTYLIIYITANKEIEIQEMELDESNNLDSYTQIKKSIVPPYNGKCLVINKDDVRTFKLNCEVVETRL